LQGETYPRKSDFNFSIQEDLGILDERIVTKDERNGKVWQAKRKQVYKPPLLHLVQAFAHLQSKSNQEDFHFILLKNTP
jgi:hypothetical protein